MIRSFRQLQRVDPGFNPRNVLTMELRLTRSKYPEESQIANFYSQVLGRVATLPGVESVGATWMLPMSGNDAGSGIQIEGREPSTPGERPRTAFSSVSPRYFHTMGIPLIKGRDFTEQDKHDAPGAVIINETFARHFFPGEDAIGKRIGRGGTDSWLTVVGVVGDVKHKELSAEPRTEMYLSYLQTPFPLMSLVVRTNGDPASLTTAIRKEVWAIDQDQPIADVETMEQLVAHSVASTRFNTLLLAVFAAVALVLSGRGLRGDGLLGHAAHARDRHPHGPGRANPRHLTMRRGRNDSRPRRNLSRLGRPSSDGVMYPCFGVRTTDPRNLLASAGAGPVALSAIISPRDAHELVELIGGTTYE